jgi:hypothetical protein
MISEFNSAHILKRSSAFEEKTHFPFSQRHRQKKKTCENFGVSKKMRLQNKENKNAGRIKRTLRRTSHRSQEMNQNHFETTNDFVFLPAAFNSKMISRVWVFAR